jgi:hypothetical protein
MMVHQLFQILYKEEIILYEGTETQCASWLRHLVHQEQAYAVVDQECILIDITHLQITKV